MTEPATITPEEAQPQTPWSPFPDRESAQFHAEKELRQAQLHAELEQALDHTVQLSTARKPGETAETIWIVPADVDAKVVEQVIADHVPDPNWGIPQATRDWFDIQRRVMEDPELELTSEEIQVVVKGLLIRQIGQ